MLRNSTFLVLSLVVLGLMAGCSDSDPTVSSGGDLPYNMVDVALQSDVITEAMIALELALMGATSATAGGIWRQPIRIQMTFPFF